MEEIRQVLASGRELADAKQRGQQQRRSGRTENLDRKPLEDFIQEVPKWRNKYLENNMCVFKVEAFIQRDWKNSCLNQPSCKENHGRVENLIEGLKGKDDSIKPEDDIEIVYRWGGGFGPMLFARIVNPQNNPIDKIRKQAKMAFSALDEGRPVEAMEQLRTLKGVNYPFGSKVLAMRSPRNAPIWDNIAQATLSEFKIGGKRVKSYEQFITFCQHIAQRLEERREANPRGTGGTWYLRDIEMAIFQFGWDNGKFNGRITGELP